MYIPFNELPPHSRIWIYQADRMLVPKEIEAINGLMRPFCEQWEAHGQPLKTSFQLALNQFLIISVNEGFASASGCSIDGSVRVLKDLQLKGINFLDSSKIAFLKNDEIKLHSRSELKELFAKGDYTSSTVTFNNLVQTMEELGTRWKIQVENSWLAKYLPNVALVQ
jgi:hypothetical protein